ncbi:MAG: hypothetical protein LM590_01420 [Thermofilum sp.]|nr:hypothetical protein [Thermofilum sp.]
MAALPNPRRSALRAAVREGSGPEDVEARPQSNPAKNLKAIYRWQYEKC